eukprot:7279473-Prymnesium_polylepis.1
MHKGAAPGLRRACDCLLSVAIDKTEQTSDWERRPLTESQKAYAAVDAAILRPLYMAVLECEASPPPISAPRAATPSPPAATVAGGLTRATATAPAA